LKVCITSIATDDPGKCEAAAALLVAVRRKRKVAAECKTLTEAEKRERETRETLSLGCHSTSIESS